MFYFANTKLRFKNPNTCFWKTNFIAVFGAKDRSTLTYRLKVLTCNNESIGGSAWTQTLKHAEDHTGNTETLLYQQRPRFYKKLSTDDIYIYICVNI